MVNKKGFIRTLEAVIAIFIMLFFVTVVIPGKSSSSGKSENLQLFETLKENDLLRDCIIIGNVTCINNTLSSALENSYDFSFNISSDPFVRVNTGSSGQVFVESVIISGNSTAYDPKILRLYYWPKQPK